MDLTKTMELFEELKRRIDEQGDYLRESEYRSTIRVFYKPPGQANR